MHCQIKRDLYEQIIRLSDEDKLYSISISPWHKGIDISINDIYRNPEFVQLEEDIAEFYFKNGFPFGGEFMPTVTDGILTFDVDFYNDQSQYDDMGSSLGIEEFITSQAGKIERLNEISVFAENFILKAKINANKEKGIISHSYSLLYLDEDNNEEIDLSDEVELKNSIIGYIHNWAADQCWGWKYHKINKNYPVVFDYEILIEDTIISKLEEHIKGGITLEIIEGQ